MIQTNPNDLHLAAESATGCQGANSYLVFAEEQEFKHLEVLDWSSSAGDWSFIVSRDGLNWQILYQENNYPRPGFSHSLSEESYEGSATEVLMWLQNSP